MANHDRARRRWLGRESRQPVRSSHPMRRQRAHFLRDLGPHGREHVVVGSLDPHNPRAFRRTKADREQRPQHDRDLPKDVTRVTHPDHPLDPVNQLDRLDPTLQDGEQRALVALMRRVLARHQADIRRDPRNLHTLRLVQAREHRDPPDLLRRHHVPQPHRWAIGVVNIPAPWTRPSAITPITSSVTRSQIAPTQSSHWILRHNCSAAG
jgi:hypothetical protein